MPQEYNLSAGLEPKKTYDLSAGFEKASSIGADPQIRPLGPIGPSVSQSTYRAATSALPWIGGGIGGELGGPPGAIIGGGSGKGLEDLLNRLAGLRQGPPDGQQADTGLQIPGIGGPSGIPVSAIPRPILEELVRIGTAALEQGGLQKGSEVASTLGKPISDMLKRSSEKSLELVLGASKEKLKAAATEKVIPGMLERKLTATSRQDLLEKAVANVHKWGEEVTKAARAADATGQRIDAKELVSRLNDVKEQLPGVIRDPEAQGAVLPHTPDASIAAVQNIQEQLVAATHKGGILPTTVINIRRALDQIVAQQKGAFLTGSEKAIDMSREWTSNAIRDTLNKKFPTLAEVNEQYSFWKNLETVMSATQQRTASQADIVGKVMRTVRGGGIGGAAGTAVAGPVGGVIGGTAGLALEQLFQSTLWRTGVSVPAKRSLAKVIATGSQERIIAAVARISGGTITVASQARESEESGQPK